MQTVIDAKDRRGYFSIHRAFETRNWGAIKRAFDSGANLNVLSPSGANLEEFADGLGLSGLYRRLKEYALSRKS